MPKREANTNLEYEVVNDDLRRTHSKWADTQLVKDLLAGKTLRVAGVPRTTSLYNLARLNSKRLRSRADGEEHSIIWMIDAPEPQEDEVEISAIDGTRIEFEKVDS